MSETYAPGRAGIVSADRATFWMVVYLGATGLVLLLMMLLGLLMRLARSGWFHFDPAVFYQIMTVHGTGMVGIAALGGVAVVWHSLSACVTLLLISMIGWMGGVIPAIVGATIVVNSMMYNAAHLPEWLIHDRIATLAAAGVIVLAAVFVVMFLARIPRILREV